MRYVLSLLCLLNISVSSSGQSSDGNLSNYFNAAYTQYPEIPRGLLEAVAFTQSRMHHIGAEEMTSCTGLPQSFTLFGLMEDGKGVFRNNLIKVSELSGYSMEQIKATAEISILAYAKALTLQRAVVRGPHPFIADFPWLTRVGMLSELPAKRDFAFDSFLYEIVRFVNDPSRASQYGFSTFNWDAEKIFGENLSLLSSSKVVIDGKEIRTPDGYTYKLSPEVQSPDYPPALWTAAASCNFSVGRAQAVSAVTIHTVQGTYAGCISWFQNCAASVSAHYVVRSSDGQITQMVLESNTAWHVGNQNSYTVGIEHEGYVAQTGWYTPAMYTSSAGLSADICASHGIDPLRTGWWPWLPTTYYNQSSIPGTCTRVKGHMHYPSQTHTDPGPNWDWDLYYKLINPAPAATMLTAASGNFYDSGGPTGNYSDDERIVWTIAPPNASTVTLTFTSFASENTWDYLFIYDGNSVNAPLIGMYTGTNSPGTVSSTGGEMTIEFRSDCSTPDAGWNASWSSNASAPPSNLSVQQSNCPSMGVNLSWNNSGTGWFVDVSSDPNFTVFYNKNVSNLSTTACPGSFCEYPSCNTYLKFEPNTTYYWRIWDGNTQTYGTPFTTPSCTYSSTNCTGSVDDSGGPNGNYGGNEDYTFTIAPPNASGVNISFSAFDLENGFDSLYVHDGPNTAAPLLGAWTGTNNPGTVNSTGGSLTLHFISDPLVNNTGFSASWNCTQLTSMQELSEDHFAFYPNPVPTGGSMILWSGTSCTRLLNLFDVTGRLIFSKHVEFSKGENLVQWPILKTGTYLLEISGSGTTFRTKVTAE